MKNFITILFLLFSLLIYSQTFVNKEWEVNSGNPIGLEWSSSIVNNNNELIHVGNSLVANQGADIKITKYNTNGQIIWESYYNSTGSYNDYGIAVIEDLNQNIYVLGATDNNTNTNHDIIVLKYNSIGTLLWSTNYNSTYNLNDIGTAIKLDNSGNIYVAALSEVNLTNQDFLLIKYSNSGNFIWSNRYDFASLTEIPISLDIDNNGFIYITGASASSLNNWDYAVAKFSDMGSLIGDARFPFPGNGFDQPLAFRKDLIGNMYITGRTSMDGINYDIKTIKLNPSYILLWEKTYDQAGKNDAGNAIDLDQNGNVLVGGYTSKANNIKEMIILKYDANGNEMWQHKQAGTKTNQDAVIKSLKVHNDVIYFVGEETGLNDTKDAIISKINNQGAIKWQKKVNSNAVEKPVALNVSNNGNVFVSLLKNGNLTEYSNLKFTEFTKDDDVVLNNQGEPIYMAHELIVRFKQNSLDINAIDNNIGTKTTEYENLDFFLRPNAMDAFNTALKDLCVRNDASTATNPCGIKAVKVFKELKTTLTTTSSRLGETIRVPDFWATLLLVFPEDMNISSVHNALKTIPNVVVYSEPNLMIELDEGANDPLYFSQKSLYNEDFFDIDTNHINIQEAWDIVPSGGNSFVRCGVVDSGIDFRHPDFGYDELDINTSKVRDGWDFKSNVALKTLDDSYTDSSGHGTSCSGIIGAIRNNNLGVAGIAGGNDLGLNDFSDKGVSLYGLKVYDTWFYTNPINVVYNAIVNSSLDINSGLENAYGLHILNNSWGIKETDISWFTDTNLTLIKEALHFANRANVSFVAARGNDGRNSKHYPAITDEDWVISVGGTGLNGHYKFQNNGFPIFDASYGNNLDIAAPACKELIKTTALNDIYSEFSQTSAAAPHVTGVVGLLMSYLNSENPSYQNLAPEDCERILELSAYDTDATGYDTLTGYGRLNAGRALRLVEKPWSKVLHFGTRSGFNYSLSNNLTSLNTEVYLKERYKNFDQVWFQQGTYKVNVYQINALVNHNIPDTDTILHFWPRPSASYVLEPISNDSLLPRERLSITSCNQNSASLVGHIYEVFDLNNNPLGWWPLDTAHLSLFLDYTLLTQDKNKPVSTVGINNLLTNSGITILPNPANNIQEIQIETEINKSVNVVLLDLYGRELKKLYNSSSNTKMIKIKNDLSMLESGIYFYQIKIGENAYLKRIIKY